MDLEQMVEEMDRLAEELEKARQHAASLQNQYDRLRRIDIPKAMEDRGISSAKFSGIGRGVRIADEVFVSCKEEHRDALLDWLRDNGETGMIRDTVAPSTLKAYVSRRIKEGGAYPADLLTVSVIPTARFY